MQDMEEELRRDIAALLAYTAKLDVALAANETARRILERERDTLRAENEQLQVEITALRDQANALRRWRHERDETGVEG